MPTGHNDLSALKTIRNSEFLYETFFDKREGCSGFAADDPVVVSKAKGAFVTLHSAGLHSGTCTRSILPEGALKRWQQS